MPCGWDRDLPSEAVVMDPGWPVVYPIRIRLATTDLKKRRPVPACGLMAMMAEGKDNREKRDYSIDHKY